MGLKDKIKQYLEERKEEKRINKEIRAEERKQYFEAKKEEAISFAQQKAKLEREKKIKDYKEKLNAPSRWSQILEGASRMGEGVGKSFEQQTKKQPNSNKRKEKTIEPIDIEDIKVI
jgi:hypothetical protein